jgi:hypothetical protein
LFLGFLRLNYFLDFLVAAFLAGDLAAVFLVDLAGTFLTSFFQVYIIHWRAILYVYFLTLLEFVNTPWVVVR